MLKALPSLFSNLLGTSSNARVEFCDKFQREADEYDRDCIKKYDEDLNTTLIFVSAWFCVCVCYGIYPVSRGVQAGLFSAVTSAFVVEARSDLRPDFQEMSYDLLRIIANVSLGNNLTGTAAAFPQWNGADPTVVRVQCILYSSLAASLFAAFIAMLGKQWFNRSARVEMRGSVIERSRHRQRKMHAMVTWHFDLVMECLPLMLQAALLLFGHALSNYLFFINRVVASVLIGFTSRSVSYFTS